MIKKYLVPIVGIMTFVSFVAFATAQTKSISESEVTEDTNEVFPDNDFSMGIPEVASANTSIDTVEESEILGRAQPTIAQDSVTTPAIALVVEEVQEPVISPAQFTNDQTDDEDEPEERHSENSRYEDDEDDDDEEDDEEGDED